MDEKETIGKLITSLLYQGHLTLEDVMPIVRKGVSKSMELPEEAIFTEKALKMGSKE